MRSALRSVLETTVAAGLLAIAASFPAHALKLDELTLGNVFTTGEPVRIAVRNGGDQVQWQATDFFGNPVTSGSESVSGGTAVITLDIPGPGYFALDVTGSTRGTPDGTAQTAIAVVPPPAAIPANSPFGVMTHFAQGWDTDIIPLIALAGIGRIRDEQAWGQVEQSAGQYHFRPALTGYMAALAAQHIDPLIILAFANKLYDGGDTPYDDAGRAAYAAYGQAVLREYGSQINSVEIWNEYNGSFCRGPCQRNRAYYYTQMLKQAYSAAKSVNPSVTVVGGAAVPIPLDYLRNVFSYGGLNFMDAVAVHPYRPQPEGVELDLAALRELMVPRGGVKPIWATEFGDIADMAKSRDNEARYLVRMCALLLSGDVERMYWYLLRDFGQFKGMGLLRGPDDPLGRYAPTPAYVAYAALVHELGGLTFVRRELTDTASYDLLFSDGTRYVRVAWTSNPSDSLQLTPQGALNVVSMMGSPQGPPPSGATVTIGLSSNPVYIEGQAALAGPYASEQVLANSVYDFTMTVGNNNWSYGAIEGPVAPLAPGTSISEKFEPLSPDTTLADWTLDHGAPLMINALFMSPGKIDKEAAWAVRRWTAPDGRALAVRGEAQLLDKTASGVTLVVLTNGQVAYAAQLDAKSPSNAVTFDVPLSLNRGGTVDIALGPSAAGDTSWDKTRVTAEIIGAKSP